MDAKGRFSDRSTSFFRPHEGRAIVPNPKRSKSPRDSCSLAPEHLNALDFNRPNREGPVVLTQALLVAARETQLSFGRAVGAQLVGHELVWRIALLLQQLAHEV